MSGYEPVCLTLPSDGDSPSKFNELIAQHRFRMYGRKEKYEKLIAKWISYTGTDIVDLNTGEHYEDESLAATCCVEPEPPLLPDSPQDIKPNVALLNQMLLEHASVNNEVDDGECIIIHSDTESDLDDDDDDDAESVSEDDTSEDEEEAASRLSHLSDVETCEKENPKLLVLLATKFLELKSSSQRRVPLTRVDEKKNDREPVDTSFRKRTEDPKTRFLELKSSSQRRVPLTRMDEKKNDHEPVDTSFRKETNLKTKFLDLVNNHGGTSSTQIDNLADKTYKPKPLVAPATRFLELKQSSCSDTESEEEVLLLPTP